MLLRATTDLINAATSLDGIAVMRDVAYGEGPRRKLDVYAPAGAAGRAVVVWFYGGAWQSGRRQDYRFLAAALARAGCVVAVPDYRLFPETAYPGFLADAADATAFVQRHAADWGGDPARLFVAGHSAGAYIAAMLTLDARWGVRQALAGAIGISGPYDFLPIRDSDIQAVFAPAADPREAQPIAHADGHGGQMLLLHGAADRTCYPRNTLALAARIRSAGGAVTAHIYPGIGHIDILRGFLPWFAWRAPVLADSAGFIARHPALRQREQAA